MLTEILRVLWALPHVEVRRQRMGPLPLAQFVRERGTRGICRDPVARRNLQRIIRYVDRCLPPLSGNCYRRALLEMALDSGAAAEPLMLGLNGGGGAQGPGHAWLASSRDGAAYDCVFSI